MLQMADYFKSKSNFYEAIQIYKKIIENHGENNRLLFLYASSLDKMGDWHKAKELLITILKKDPEETYTLNYFAYSLALRDEELDLALNHIKKALSLDPNNGFFLDTLGWVEFKRENYTSSVFYLEKSIMILPRSSEVMDHLGDCYLMLGRTKEAVYEWKKALKYENNITVINSIKDKLNKYE
jgi:tetratricopeptide (TPR) repeat protein